MKRKTVFREEDLLQRYIQIRKQYLNQIRNITVLSDSVRTIKIKCLIRIIIFEISVILDVISMK